MSEFRILITGSRDWSNSWFIERILKEYVNAPNVTLVSGHCPTGADKLCEDYAESVGWKIERHPADWAQYGKRAGFVRNSDMVSSGAHVCLAFIKENSKGATMTKNLAEKAGIETRVFREEDLEKKLDLRPHQLKALRNLSNGKILWGGVGTGKSRVAATYYKEYEAPKHVYVITTAKKRDSFDWQEEFYRLEIGPAEGPVSEPPGKGKGRGGRSGSSGDSTGPTELDVGRPRRSGDKLGLSGADESSVLLLESDRRLSPGGGHDQSSQEVGGYDTSAGIYPWVLTVDSWNNIAKYADVAGAFFIFDEQRLVGSGDWTRKFLRIAKRNNWILLSGTPGDTWLDYIPVFVANDFYKNRTAFKREHVVYNTFTKFPKVDRYINVGKLMRQRAQLLVEMPYERHTKRRTVEVPLRFDKEALEMVLKKRWHIYENRPLRDIAELFSVGRKVVNSDRSRIEMVKELWQKHPKLIVFYNFNYELEILRDLSSMDSTFHLSESMGFDRCDTQVAEWNGHKHQPIPQSDRWLYLVQYTAGAEGWNCIETDAMIMYSRNYSWKIYEQACGRIDRLNTPFQDLWYYDFTSESFIDLAIGRSLKAKETFNEAKYARLFA